jgi:rfaE bifunctional protein kinase chain/domain
MGKVTDLFNTFDGRKIIVIGDVMIDAYTLGQVTRLSPEAPVPIVSLDHHDFRLGGAANVALNLVALGAQPIVCSVVGNDWNGEKMIALLNDAGISSEGIVQSPTRKTTVKTRVIANRQQLLRIDDEQTDLLENREEEELIERIKQLVQSGAEAIIFEDYNKGVLTPRVIEQVIAYANSVGIITAVDPKKDQFLSYKHVTLFKPNLKELKEGLNVQFDFKHDRSSFELAVQQLEQAIQCDISFVTLSEHGVFIKQSNAAFYASAHVRNIADVSGAGDTVIAVATLCLLSGMEVQDIAEVANIAGGLVCEEIGVVSINKELLMHEVDTLLAKKH